MKLKTTDSLLAGLGATLLFAAAGTASGAACVNGVYRAGCAGPNGAVVVRKPAVRAPVCANGVYRAGCIGPNGAVVVAKPYAAPHAVVVAPVVRCTYINGQRVCR
jgi:hypothetical protein